jgi:hypothetical protein
MPNMPHDFYLYRIIAILGQQGKYTLKILHQKTFGRPYYL